MNLFVTNFIVTNSNVLDFDSIWDWTISFMHNKALQSSSCSLLLKILNTGYVYIRDKMI